MKSIEKKLLILTRFLIMIFLFCSLQTTVSGGKVGIGNLNDVDTEIMTGADPFFFTGGDTAVLVIHGFGSCPHEMKALGEYLNRQGLTVEGILLPGHGTSPYELEKTTWQDWYGKVEGTYLELEKNYSRVFVVGFSLGGVLALHLAAYQSVERLVILSPYIFLDYKWFLILPPRFYANTIGRLFRFIRRPILGSINDPEALSQHVAYRLLPMKAVRSSFELVDWVKEEVESVHAPILIIQSLNDKAVSPRSAQWVYDQVASNKKKLVWVERANHFITVDYDKDSVFMEVVNFLLILSGP